MRFSFPSLSRRALALGLAAGLGLPLSALAQTGITKLIVAFPPGGPVDFVARTISEPLSKELGQQVIVENKPGANGAIAAEYVSRAVPDGHTLWLTSVGAVAINPSLYEKLSYDPQRDLTPVSQVVRNVEMLVVAANAPYNTGADLVAAARKPGSQLTMASSGIGSVPHLASALLNEAGGTQMLHVPFKGAAPAIAEVMAGRVTGFFGDIPGLIGHIHGGKLKPIGIAAEHRHPSFPDVKTFAEMGFTGVDSDNWYAVFGPKGMSAAEAQKLSAALRRVLTQDKVKSRLLASGAEPAPSSPEQLGELLKKDSAKWARVIKANNIHPE